MKKIVIASIVFVSSFIQAQRGSHEVSLDLADALIMRTVELNYEYYVSDQSTVGISGLVNFESKTSDFRYNEKNMITPYFRHYFTANRNWNYFGEVFFGVNTGYKTIDLDGSNAKRYREYTDGALGVSFGTKYISNGGFMVYALAGLGRNMFTEESYILVPRAGLSVGYRF